MGKEALEVYKSLKRNSDSMDLIEKLQHFKDYLSHLCTVICPNGLKDNFIYHWVYKHEIRKQKDYESYCKANIFASKTSLNRIIAKIEREGMNEVINKILTDFICDLKPFIAYFDNNQDYSWLLINPNIHTSNFYYDLSINVFWSGKPGRHPEEKLVLASSTPFIIRQSIEYKVKRILGIDYWLINKKPDIRATERCFTAIENNKQFYKTTNFDFKVVKQIYSWTNLYIHGGYRPEPWRTETAINYLEPLFHSGPTSAINSFSLYASVEILESDLTKVREMTEENIKSGIQGDIKIKWLDKPEVAIIR